MTSMAPAIRLSHSASRGRSSGRGTHADDEVAASQPATASHGRATSGALLPLLRAFEPAAARAERLRVAMRATARRCAPLRASHVALQRASAVPALPPVRVGRAAASGARSRAVLAAAAADGGGAPAAEVREALSSASGVVTDASVPEAHRGLHATLYGDGGAEAHDAGAGYRAREVRRRAARRVSSPILRQLLSAAARVGLRTCV